MSIADHADDTIDVYSFVESRDSEGGWQRDYTFVDTVDVYWLWNASTIDETRKQQDNIQSSRILTDDPDVYALFEVRGTIVVYQNVKYQVDSKEDVGNKQRVFAIDVSESSVQDMTLVGGLSGSGEAEV